MGHSQSLDKAQPFISVLGDAAAARFFLNYGGSTLYLAQAPTAQSTFVREIGFDKTVALAQKLGSGNIKIPIAKLWLAQYYVETKGWSKAKAARIIRVDEATIRRWLSPGAANNQLSLFD